MIHQLLGGRINMALLAMAEVVLVLGPPTYNPKKTILIETVKIGGFRHINTSAHHPTCIY